MANNEIDLFGKAHVKVEFILVLKKATRNLLFTWDNDGGLV